MKFDAKITAIKTGRDSGGQTYTELKMRLYAVPEQGKVDVNTRKAALFLTAIPYSVGENHFIEVDIADPTIEE